MNDTKTIEEMGTFTAEEIGVLIKTVGSFSTGGHPYPDRDTISFFRKEYIAELLKDAETLLHKQSHKDFPIVQQLLARFKA